jgi:hypothetical protein
MDYDNPEFIAAVKKVLGNLRGDEEPPSAEQKQGDPEIEQALSPPPSPHALNISDSTIDRIKAPTEHEKSHEWWRDFIEIAGIGVVALYTMFAFFQWKELNTANIIQSAVNIEAIAKATELEREIRKNAVDTRDLVVQAGKQADAAGKQAAAALKQSTETEAIAKAAQTQATASLVAANAAKGSLEMADRPWIKGSVTSTSALMFQNGAVSLAVTIRTENVGHSVATAIFPQAKLITIHGADFIDGPRRQAKQLCDEVSDRFERVKSSPSVWSNAIFPGESSEFASGGFLLPPEINSTTVDAGANLGQSITLMLIGCIEYHYATSDKPHRTWFLYTLSHNVNPVPCPGCQGQIFFPIGKDISSADMVLIKGDQFAD